MADRPSNGLFPDRPAGGETQVDPSAVGPTPRYSESPAVSDEQIAVNEHEALREIEWEPPLGSYSLSAIQGFRSSRGSYWRRIALIAFALVALIVLLHCFALEMSLDERRRLSERLSLREGYGVGPMAPLTATDKVVTSISSGEDLFDEKTDFNRRAQLKMIEGAITGGNLFAARALAAGASELIGDAHLAPSLAYRNPQVAASVNAILLLDAVLNHLATAFEDREAFDSVIAFLTGSSDASVDSLIATLQGSQSNGLKEIGKYFAGVVMLRSGAFQSARDHFNELAAHSNNAKLVQLAILGAARAEFWGALMALDAASGRTETGASIDRLMAWKQKLTRQSFKSDIDYYISQLERVH